MRKYKVSLTTDGSGNVIGYTPRLAGKVHSIQYLKDGTNGFSNGVDFTITNETSGEQIWAQNDVNASALVYPRAGTHSNAGVAALFATGGTAVNDKMPVANDRIKISIASGGAAKVGIFYIYTDN